MRVHIRTLDSRIMKEVKMSEIHDDRWFLVQLKPNCYSIAERNLRRQGFETFLPLQDVTARKDNKFLSKLRPLFPGYLFVSLDVTQSHWRAVNSTYGINRLVSFGNVPSRVPNILVQQLMARCDRAGKFIPADQLQPGVEVLLTKGPFTNFVATIERVTPDQRVWILLDIIGRMTRVAVRADHVRAV